MYLSWNCASETGKLRYHNDELMEALGKKVKVEIPWNQATE